MSSPDPETRAALLTILHAVEPANCDITRSPVRATRRGRPQLRAHGLKRSIVIGTVAFPFVVAGAVNLPFYWVKLTPIDGYTINGIDLLMVAEMVVALLLLPTLGRYPRNVLARVGLYAGLLLWALATTIWAPPALTGVMELLPLVLFGVEVCFTGCIAAVDGERTATAIERGMKIFDVLGLFIAGVMLVRYGWAQQLAPADRFAHPRILAMAGMTSVCWHLSQWSHGHNRSLLPASLWAVAIFISLSRLETATVGVLLVVTGLIKRNPGARLSLWRRGVPVALAVALMCAALLIQPFYTRIFVHDSAELNVDDTGRLHIWEATAASAIRSPLIGNGLGSSVAVVQKATGNSERQPHNEYLRIWHNLGLVGLMLFVASCLAWLVVLRGTHVGHSQLLSQLECAGLLAAISLGCMCLAEAPFSHVSVISPLGVLIGGGLGATPRTVRRRKRRRGMSQPTGPADERMTAGPNASGASPDEAADVLPR